MIIYSDLGKMEIRDFNYITFSKYTIERDLNFVKKLFIF